MKIPIKKYSDDLNLSWEERYKRLELHHKEETEWLISKIKRLEEIINNDFLKVVRTNTDNGRGK
jgi:hypothetical protein